MTIPGIGEMTALIWVLEIGEVQRFGRISQAVSYCGLCSAQNESAGKSKRGPISKKRNKHPQTVLIEAAKLAPHWNPELAIVHERELAKGNRNRATLAVARKLVAYMPAVDRNQKKFVVQKTALQAAYYIVIAAWFSHRVFRNRGLCGPSGYAPFGLFKDRWVLIQTQSSVMAISLILQIEAPDSSLRHWEHMIDLP